MNQYNRAVENRILANKIASLIAYSGVRSKIIKRMEYCFCSIDADLGACLQATKMMSDIEYTNQVTYDLSIEFDKLELCQIMHINYVVELLIDEYM